MHDLVRETTFSIPSTPVNRAPVIPSVVCHGYNTNYVICIKDILNMHRRIKGVREAIKHSRISTKGEYMTDPKWYDMTVKKASANLEMLINGLDRLCDRYVIGEEIGEGGYEHYQIRAVFKVGKERATVHNQLGEIGAPECWVTPTSKEGRNFNYCEKEGKFIRSWEKVLRKFASIELRPWQSQVEGLMQAQNDRQCLVVVDVVGNHGKTWLAKYMQATHQAQYVPPMQDAQDFMAFCLEKPSHGYMFDMPRAESVKQRKGMWSAIEQIKNGYIYDKRYKFRDEWIEPPKVCVFCNEPPDTDMLSADRWYIVKIVKWGDTEMLLPWEEGEI